jgi:hypothetical protein
MQISDEEKNYLFEQLETIVLPDGRKPSLVMWQKILEEQFYTEKQMCELLRITQGKLYHYVRKNIIPRNEENLLYERKVVDEIISRKREDYCSLVEVTRILHVGRLVVLELLEKEKIQPVTLLSGEIVYEKEKVWALWKKKVMK